MKKTSVSPLLGLVGLVMVVSLGIVGCGGGTAAPQQPTVDPNVHALAGDRPEMSITLPDGALPCGLGQIGWGQQMFTLADYPACQAALPNVTVYCLNEQAQWTVDSIKVTGVSADGKTLTIDSQREGICGIFPQG